MSVKNELVTIEQLLEKVKQYDNKEKDLKLIRKAYEYAREKHFSQKRITGEEYIIHPLNVAYILTDINADVKALCGALLHDTIEDCEVTKEQLTKLFDQEIANLVECVTKINKLKFNTDTEQMAANQQKILVGLAEDVRVIMIKLADRLHNMRTLYVMSEIKQKKKAKETLEILTPVAHRLGIYKIKSELEDLSLRYLNPDAYYDVVEKLNLKKSQRDEAVGKMINEVSKLLDNHNIKHEIKGRSKSIYSIYNKLSKGRKFEDIYDILALRVFVDTTQECYLALGLIHSKYKPVPKRFKDFIAMPKTNLYQSLHTTVFGIDGQLFEIQIRTYEMDKIAEYGIASHWAYKENKTITSKNNMDQKLEIFRNIIELNENAHTPEEFINSIKKDILINDSIYVYTPKGDVLELPAMATPVDFAYKVHSEVGNKIVSAIVNDKIVPLNYNLKTGDIIKINTSNTARPSKDWIKFVVTAGAKNKIKAYYNKIEKDEDLEEGITLFEKELRKKELPIDDTINNYEKILMKKFRVSGMNELYINIGSGKVTMESIMDVILPKKKTLNKVIDKIKEKSKIDTKNEVLVEGLKEIKVSLSGCCQPVKGDNIIGYVTKGNGITVHRTNCRNIAYMDERLVDVKWNENIQKKYLTELLVYTNSEDCLFDIMNISHEKDIMVDSVNTLNKGKYKIYSLSILVENKDKLDDFCASLNGLSFVVKVERVVS